MKSSRWKMNRFGFVNFWKFKDEVFDLKDGKILIRGANGSGKSVVTQSIISFILDGDRSPSRLDPFGSKERKMEYYLLGNGEKDGTQIGYIYLEFKKESMDKYLTIGIGQRARQGSQMGFWGFVLCDGRRVGVDFKLYTERGDKKIPLSDKELKIRLGEDNFFVATQKEYVELVNKHLFGFYDIYSYKTLINSLLKIRTSKLSTNIKPRDVKEILKDSLKIWEESDMETFSNTLKTLDDMSEKNEKRKKAKKSIGDIIKEYDKYNRFLLWKKKEQYTKAQREYEDLNSKILKIKSEIENMKANFEKNKDEIVRKENEIQGIEEKIENLGMKDLAQQREKLANLKKEIEEKEREILIKTNNIKSVGEDLRKSENEIERIKKKRERSCYEAKKICGELEDLKKATGFDGEIKKDDIFKDIMVERLDSLKNNFYLHQKYIEKGLESLEKYGEVLKKFEEQKEIVAHIEVEHTKAEKELRSAEEEEEIARNKTIESFYTQNRENQFIKFYDEEKKKIVELLEKYMGSVEKEEIEEIVYSRYRLEKDKLETEEIFLENSKKIKLGEREEKFSELENFKNKKEFEPLRSVEREECRRELEEVGIKFLPLYKCIDFAQGTPQEIKNILEGQLRDTGLLDALIISKKDRTKAKKIVQKYSDIFIDLDKKVEKNIDFSAFVVEDIDRDLGESVEEFLKYTSEGVKSDFVLSESGYFKNGILEGYRTSLEEVSYIGEKTRKERFEKEVLKREEVIRSIDIHIEELEERKKKIGASILVLSKEYENFPKFGNIETGIHLIKGAKEKVESIKKRLSIEIRNLDKIEMERKECGKNVEESCKRVNLKREVEVYRDAKDSIFDYQNKLSELKEKIDCYKNLERNISFVGDLIESNRMNIGNLYLEKNRLEREVLKSKNSIKDIDENMERGENREKLAKLKELEEEKERTKKFLDEVSSKNIRIEKDIEYGEKDYEKMKTDLEEKEGAFKDTQSYYNEELELGYVNDIEKLSFKEGKIDNIVSGIWKRIRENGENLDEYRIDSEEKFEEDPQYFRRREVFFIKRKGETLSLYDIYNTLEDEIRENEMMISNKNRELFEEILYENIGGKIRVLIRESSEWIKIMNKIMLQMDTSSNVRFSLDWKPKEKFNENELDMSKLVELLEKDKNLILLEDSEKIKRHFKSKIEYIRRETEINKKGINSYEEAIKKVLDYRDWYEFKINIHRDEKKQVFTDSVYGKVSGGEKAMSIYVPLLAAISAQYAKAREDAPQLIALDEAFAGMDDKNISLMFDLIEKLGFDYIMNSQTLWGDYEGVKNLSIAELQNRGEENSLDVFKFSWDGKRRELNMGGEYE